MDFFEKHIGVIAFSIIFTSAIVGTISKRYDIQQMPKELQVVIIEEYPAVK